MKVLTEKYPKGTLKYQKTDGRYIDNYLYDNLKLMAGQIVKDMTFLGVIFSSTLEVGTGKSVFATQIGEVWAELIKEMHGKECPFTTNNVVWRAKELIDRSFDVPKYSMILLDEWEDAHYWSELGITLRTFFRKCRQQNLFILMIIPNFFQLPMSYAIGRSIFAIDVYFGKGFSRGNFKFYGFKSKRRLFLNGKKFHNYNAQASDFDGRFFDGYGVPREDYIKAKALDLEKWETEDKKAKSPEDIWAGFIKLYAPIFKKDYNIPHKAWSDPRKKDRSTISHILSGKNRGNEGVLPVMGD